MVKPFKTNKMGILYICKVMITYIIIREKKNQYWLKKPRNPLR